MNMDEEEEFVLPADGCPWEQTKLTVHRRDANNAHHLSRSYLLHLDHDLREKREHGSLPISQLAANIESNGDEHEVASDEKNWGWLADLLPILSSPCIHSFCKSPERSKRKHP